MIKRLRGLAFLFSPAILFATLLFSDPTHLFGGVGTALQVARTNAEAEPEPDPNRIIMAIDSSLAYSPSLMKAGLVYDHTEHKVVWEKNMNTKFPVASLTKMMVALIAMEMSDEGIISLTDTVTVSKMATYVGGSSLFLKAGQKLMLEEVLGAAMVRSGNDAAYTVAEHIGGTEAKFVQMMNKRASALKMKSTAFYNSTGMPNKNGIDNVSTAADMLLLAREMVKYDCILDYTCRSTDQIRNANGIFTYENRNALVKSFDEIDGLKTGFTKAAGYCVVATSQRCGHRVTTIILGVATKDQRNDIAVNLFNNYYKSIGLGTLGEKFDTVTAKAQ
jgi:D-alanyl-D-alanine carboxypeptidase (penicillin-binding protein 5/6)